MSKVALLRIADNEIIEIVKHGARASWEGGSVSPAQIGWKGGGELERIVEGPPRYRIVAYEPASPPPEGKRSIGSTIEYDAAADVVREVLILEDIPPPPPEPTPAEKLKAATGLTVEELKTLLGLSSSTVR